MTQQRRRSRDGLYKRENQILAFRYKAEDGRWREKYTGTTNRQEARDFKRDFMEQLSAGALPNDLAKWRLEAAIGHYMSSRKGIIGARTLQIHSFRAKALVRILGNKKLEEVTNRDLDNYQGTRRQQGRLPSTVNKELEILVYLLRKAKLWRRLEAEYKPLSVPQRSPRCALNTNDFLTLVKTGLSKPHWEAVCLASIVAANTTCRSWEIKSLQLKEISFDPINPKLVIRRENTKSDAGAREVELNPLAMWAVQRLAIRAARMGATEPNHYLFPADLSRHTKRTDPLNGRSGFDPNGHQQSWKTAWRSMAKAAGLPWVHFHDLRHTAITRAREQGVDMAIVKAIAGHMNARMTDYYTHIGSAVKRDAVNRIGEAYQSVMDILCIEDSASKRVN